MEKLETFLKTCERLAGITGQYGDIKKARDIPDQKANVSRLRISGDSYYRLTDEDEQAAKEAFKEISRKRRLTGEIERDELLSKLSLELDAIRSDLPRQAAQAAIELGQIARDIFPAPPAHGGEHETE